MQGHPVLFAANHVSYLDIAVLGAALPRASFVANAEVRDWPFFGTLAKLQRTVFVNRQARRQTTQQRDEMTRRLEAGDDLILFPEGTRRTPGAEPAYKYGIVHLYDRLKSPVLPIALNSGVYWPRRKFLRRPGTIVVEILDPIQPGKPKEVFHSELMRVIEEASNRLLAEGRGELVQEGTPQPADERPGG
jgi:1-acyl-sn-glycerol-3-phosphate acyltransferase